MVKLRQTMSKGTEVWLTAVRCVVKYAIWVGVRRYADVSCRYGGGTATQWHVGVSIAHQVTRRHGGVSLAHQVARWCLGGEPDNKVAGWCHGGTPGNTVALWCNGGAPGGTATLLRHVGGMWHGGTVWLVARWNDNSVALFPGYVILEWWHGELAVTRYLEPWTHDHPIYMLSYVNIFLIMIFQIFLLILNSIIISFLSNNIIRHGTRQWIGL